MQTRRYIVMVVSALLIVVLLLIFTDPWSTLRRDGKRIALSNASNVDRIVLSDSYDSTVLVREGLSWLLNGEEPASKVPVENLLIAAERIEISSIVSVASESGDKGTWTEASRRISFYHGEKPLLVYDMRVQGDRYMLSLPGSDQNFFVAVAGYPGLNLDRVFSSSSNHYREHILIDLLPSEISRIGIELQGGQSYSFTQDEQGNINCFSSNDQTEIPMAEPDDLSTRLLFSYFTSIMYESRAGITADSISGAGQANQRMARLQVESFKGEDHTLQIFPYHETPGAEAHMFKALVLYNNDPGALLVNYIYLDVLMRDLSHYFGDK